MHERLHAALRILGHICDRPDPLEPVPVGALAQLVGTSTSSASRICAELDGLGLIARGAYGSYRIGATALALSGRAAAPYANAVDFALTLAYQATGETVALVAGSPAGATVIGVVESAWTLHVGTRMGDHLADPDSAPGRALRPAGDGVAPDVLLSEVGVTTEMATPVTDPWGDPVAALVVRCPSHRAAQVIPKARRAIINAREHLEKAVSAAAAGGIPGRIQSMAVDAGDDLPALTAATRILTALTDPGGQSCRDIAARTGLRPERARRIVDVLIATGFVRQAPDLDEISLQWSVHCWHRAIADGTLRGPAQQLVDLASDRAGTTAYLTVRRGMRSATMAEAIVDGPLQMGSWLGRPAQLIGSDGGPVLVMNLDDAQIRQVFPPRITMTASGTPKDLEAFLLQVRRARVEQILALPDFGEDGLTSVAAPVRDASGSVIAAACIVGPTGHMSARLEQLKQLAGELAGGVSHLLREPR